MSVFKGLIVDLVVQYLSPRNEKYGYVPNHDSTVNGNKAGSGYQGKLGPTLMYIPQNECAQDSAKHLHRDEHALSYQGLKKGVSLTP